MTESSAEIRKCLSHPVIDIDGPMAEYFPAPDQGGVLDDDTLFYGLFDGEPRAEDGYLTLSTAPGFGLELNEDRIRQWRIAG